MSDTGGTQFARGAVAVACADDGDFILLCADSVVLAVAQHNGGVLISSGKEPPVQDSRCSTSLITSALVGSSPLNPGPAIVEK